MLLSSGNKRAVGVTSLRGVGGPGAGPGGCVGNVLESLAADQVGKQSLYGVSAFSRKCKIWGDLAEMR